MPLRYPKGVKIPSRFSLAISTKFQQVRSAIFLLAFAQRLCSFMWEESFVENSLRAAKLGVNEGSWVNPVADHGPRGKLGSRNRMG